MSSQFKNKNVNQRMFVPAKIALNNNKINKIKS